MGVEPSTPSQLILQSRDPLLNDYHYDIGTWWVERNPQKVFILAQVNDGVATWIQLYPTSGTMGASSFPTNSGTATQVGGILNVLGTNVIQTSGAGNTVTTALTNAANGEILIGGGSQPTYGNIIAGTNISITNGPNAITIANTGSGSGANSFVSNSGTATPSSGVIALTGGELINTTGSGNTVTWNLNRSTNGKIPIAKTGAATIYANILSADSSVTITNGPNSIDLVVPGSSSFIVNKKRITSFIQSSTSVAILNSATPTTSNTTFLTSISFTPASSTNILEFEFNVCSGGSVAGGGVYCLFQGTTLLNTLWRGYNTTEASITLLYYQVSGTTSPTTYSVYYAGAATPATASNYVNIDVSGNSSGSSLSYTFTITEEIP